MKKILLVIVLVVIVGSIWYLESMKVHPSAQSGVGSTQAMNVSLENDNSSSTSPSVVAALNTIVAADKQAGFQPATEIAGPTGFINASSSFKLSDLVGKKVVLLDFWTYSCVNCVRTLPYLTSWYSKYKDQGLVIVGIHTPEFDFEKDIKNVQAAVKQYGIDYPVVLDSNYGTWQAYGNLYWPHEYLIDIAGYIVHDHVGEGGYDETEGLIQKLLAERASALGTSTTPIANTATNVPSQDLSGIGSPETYFGAARNQYLANGMPFTPGTQVLQEPQSVDLNGLYLVGSWNFADQYATNNASGAKIIFRYSSSKVYIVASGAGPGVQVEVLQDGKPISDAAAGSDVRNGKLNVTGSRLYSVVNNPDGAGEHTLELIVDSPGLQAFTFTFG